MLHNDFENFHEEAMKPESRLSLKDRNSFETYISLARDAAEHGCFTHLIYEDISDAVRQAFISNGFSFINKDERAYLSWEGSSGDGFATTFNEVATLINSEKALSYSDSAIYGNVLKKCREAAKSGRFFEIFDFTELSEGVLELVGNLTYVKFLSGGEKVKIMW